MPDDRNALAAAPAGMEPEFRGAMRRLASSVAIIALRDGVLRGMTVTSLVSVTMEPPTILVCINRSASIHPHLQPMRRISVNLLAAGQADVAAAFAGKVPPEDRFRCGVWREREGTPILEGAQANLLCTIAALSPVGSHTIVLAAVEQVTVSGVANPLVYCNGRYHVLADGVLPVQAAGVRESVA